MPSFNNREIADILSETARLMELHEVNEFKIKSIQNAAFTIGRMEPALNSVPAGELEQIKGIGKSISQKIVQILETGTLTELEDYLRDTPAGVVEMMHIKGIGPKKVALLWKQLGVESPGELLYACNENRLVALKGFGSKTQEQIKKAIEYKQSSKGFFHFATIEEPAKKLLAILAESGVFKNVELTGAIRRKCEVVQKIELIASCSNLSETLINAGKLELLNKIPFEINNSAIAFTIEEGVPVTIFICEEQDFYYQQFINTAGDGHIQKATQLKSFELLQGNNFKNESELYSFLGLDFIEPELREGYDEIELALNHSLPELVTFEDLRGCLHNHSTYSDGMHTLKEMAVACRDLNYDYLGICDHSKSAFYANGLNEKRVRDQHSEIDLLNRELAPFRIFKGIESDILADGSLDYPEAILKEFDFIVASVHSGLKMTMEKATTRILKAISNPYTTILGHPTGRLLLSREGYPLDHKSIIDACAVHNVIIELNAHPYRLDLDWRWIRYAIDKNVMIAVNPDAHHISGYRHMYYGVCAGRKGGLTKKMTFNALSLEETAEWFATKKQSAIQNSIV